MIGVRENDDQPIICDNTIDITKGYYLKDNIYYRCHSNCLKCSGAPISDTEMNCDECIEGLYYNTTNKNCDPIKEKEEGGNGHTLIIVIISLIAAIIIVLIIIVFFYLKRNRLESDKIEAL